MMVKIFSNLDRKGLLTARAVSKRWNGVVLRNMHNAGETFKVNCLRVFEINFFFCLGQPINNHLC
jgi:hypothetical protein